MKLRTWWGWLFREKPTPEPLPSCAECYYRRITKAFEDSGDLDGAFREVARILGGLREKIVEIDIQDYGDHESNDE